VGGVHCELNDDTCADAGELASVLHEHKIEVSIAYPIVTSSLIKSRFPRN